MHCSFDILESVYQNSLTNSRQFSDSCDTKSNQYKNNQKPHSGALCTNCFFVFLGDRSILLILVLQALLYYESSGNCTVDFWVIRRLPGFASHHHYPERILLYIKTSCEVSKEGLRSKLQKKTYKLVDRTKVLMSKVFFGYSYIFFRPITTKLVNSSS